MNNIRLHATMALDSEMRKGTIPPQHVLDKIADRAFSGGFKIGRKNICPKCFTAKPVNGACCE